MVCLCSRCAQTVHALDMEIENAQLDRAKFNVVKVVSVLGHNLVVLGAITFSRQLQILCIRFMELCPGHR